MRWLACAALLALSPPLAAQEARGVLVLSGAHHRERETVLADALRIYMRSLGRTVRPGGPAPASLAPAELERVANDARGKGGEVVVWFGERAGAAVLYALRVGTHELRETAVGLDDPLQAARTLALKVRVLIAVRSAGSEWSVSPESRTPPPPPDTPPAGARPAASAPSDAAPAGAAPSATATPAGAASAGTPAPDPTADSAPPSVDPAVPTSASEGVAPSGSSTPPSASSTAPATPSPGVAPPSAVLAATPRARRTWLEATVAYGATVPTQTAWVRHGLTVRLAMPWGRLPLATFVDASFTTESSTLVESHTIAARVWPLGLGIAARLRRPRWQLSGGPRVSLQIVDADARTSDGRSGAARRYSAGLGLLGEVAWLFSRHVAAVASVSVEALVPRIELAAGGAGTTDLGWVQFGFTAGAVFSIP